MKGYLIIASPGLLCLAGCSQAPLADEGEGAITFKSDAGETRMLKLTGSRLSDPNQAHVDRLVDRFGAEACIDADFREMKCDGDSEKPFVARTFLASPACIDDLTKGLASVGFAESKPNAFVGSAYGMEERISFDIASNRPQAIIRWEADVQ